MPPKHTQGPWMFKRTDRTEDEKIIIPAGKPSYEVYSNGHDGQGNGTVLWAVSELIDDEANARLIAAAPELLTMLRRLHDEVMMDEAVFSKIAPLTLEHVRKALEKAEAI
jgi:hypothetical protein